MARPKPPPPPSGQLIARKRLAPPKMSVTEAARRAGISDTRWSQLEKGYRMNRGRPEEEWAPADTLALMARVAGVTPAELEEAGRADAAAELAELPPLPADPPHTGGQPTWQDFERLAVQNGERMKALEQKLDEFMEGRGRTEEGPRSEQTTNQRRRAV